MPKFEPVAYVDEDDDNKWATLVDDLDIKLNAPLYTAEQLAEAYEAGAASRDAEIEELLAALKPFGAIDLVESRLPAEFAMLILRARARAAIAKARKP